MDLESSYGIIPLQEIDGAWYVLVIQQQAGHWSFPKGRAEENEEPLESAMRELKEETGLDVKKLIGDQPVKERYTFVRNNGLINKTVFYFLAFVEGILNLQPEEVSNAKWMKLEDAYNQVTYPEAKATCKRIEKILSKTEQT